MPRPLSTGISVGGLLAGILASPLGAQVPAPASDQPTQHQLERYDKNHDGRLDSGELAAQQADERQLAQTSTRPGSAPTAKVGDDGTITMAAFEVNTDRDKGFVATNAGSATKLGLDLKEMAAPYSVMTGQFIQTIGITDLQQAAMWATNGAPVLDGQGADLFGGSSVSTPSSMYFTRGVILNAGQQRNFFLTGGLSDTYNVERIDFGRGPNAVFFNVGANDALGGGISTVGKRARTDRNFETLSATTGSFDYYRGTLDANRVLSDKLAVRLNLVAQTKGGWLNDQFEDKRGITFAATYKLGERTELNVEVLQDKDKRARVPIPYMDNLSGWNGKTVFDAPITLSQINGKSPLSDGSLLTEQGSPQGVWRQGSNDYVYDPATNTVMNWIYSGSTRRGDENPSVPVYFGDVVWTRGGNGELLPLGNAGASGGNLTPAANSQGGGQDAFYDMINLPSNRFDRQVANSHFVVPDKRFSAMPKTPLFEQTTTDANLRLAHQVGDSLFLEISGDVNRVKETSSASHLGFRIGYIDINKNLPNGQPNPHFLDAYSESDDTFNHRTIDNWGVRAVAGYVKDLGKWGNYTFNTSVSANGRTVMYDQMTRSMGLAADPREWHAGNQKLRLRYYWQGDTSRPWGDVSPTSVVERTASTDGNTITTSTLSAHPRWVLQNWEKREESTTSGIFAFAARYFDNRLIVSPGLRLDHQTAYLRQKPTSWGFLPVDANWDGMTLDDRYWRPDAPSDWKTLSYTPKNADGTPKSSTPVPAFGSRPTIGGVNDVNPADPLYAKDRFRGDYNNPRWSKNILTKTAGVTVFPVRWAAVKLNYGTAYKPADTGRFTLVGDDADPETGVAYEAAVTFSLFQDRLSFTPRYYFNRKDNRLGDPPTTTPFNDLMGRRPWNDPNPSSRNSFGYTNVLGGDYFSTKNDGVEFEVAGEIVRGWRLMGNFGTAQLVDYNRWKNTRAYILSRKNEMLEVLKAAGGAIDTTQRPTNAGHDIADAPGVAIADPNVTDAMITAAHGDTNVRYNAVQNYNNIWVQYDNINLLKDTVGLKRMKINIYTDYTFQTGTLKGLRLGLGWQYVDQDRAGYRSGDTVANPNFDASKPVSSTNRPWMDDAAVDINTPIWTKRPSEFMASVGYTMRLHSRWRVIEGKELELQLNVHNLLNSRNTYYQDDGVALRPPDGDYTKPNRVAVPTRIAQFQDPINFELTATLKL
ncbi:hypothetical protein DB347_20075 [Opitutaceae bacterium EW11]|nr:hypothetical protein DB347_20075 [Opitutaceae bacterium EW11]